MKTCGNCKNGEGRACSVGRWGAGDGVDNSDLDRLKSANMDKCPAHMPQELRRHKSCTGCDKLDGAAWSCRDGFKILPLKHFTPAEPCARL